MRHWRAPFDRQGYHHGNLKEALIEAAQRFIAERGLGGFTLADAAKLVGVTPAALYRHFRGREALVAEVAFRGFTQLAERLARALQGEGTPLERFTRMGEVYLAFAEQEPGFYAAMFAPRNSDPAPAAAGGSQDGPPSQGTLSISSSGPCRRPSRRDLPASTCASSPSRSGPSRTASPPFRRRASFQGGRGCPTSTNCCGPASWPSSMAPAAATAPPRHLPTRTARGSGPCRDRKSIRRS